MVNQKHLGLLKSSVLEWNKWREENDGVEIDLEGANLEFANLEGANLKHANLQYTYLQYAKLQYAKLQYAYLLGAYLQYTNLLGADLLGANLQYTNLQYAKLEGANLQDANLQDANLQDANLQDANLQDANLLGADLQDANLLGADLLGADLTITQALKTNFQNANLTGTCIQDWHINNETQFDGVICEYIYLKGKYQNYQLVFSDRRPHDPNKTFAPGDFACLFQQINETLDLIFSKGIDWQAFLPSLQALQVEAGESHLRVQAIENKHDGAFVVKVAVPEDFDKGEMEKFFWQKYELKLEAAEEKYRSQLQAKDIEIDIHRRQNADIMEIAKLLASRPINVEAKAVAGDKIEAENIGIAKVSGGEINDSKVAGVINEAEEQNLAQAAEEIQQLLEQLEKTYPTETTADKMGLATEAITQIENNPPLKGKIVRAVKAGSMAAMEKMLNHPAASFVAAALRELK